MRDFFCFVVFSLIARTQRRSCFANDARYRKRYSFQSIRTGQPLAQQGWNNDPGDNFLGGHLYFRARPALGIRWNHLPQIDQRRLIPKQFDVRYLVMKKKQHGFRSSLFDLFNTARFAGFAIVCITLTVVIVFYILRFFAICCIYGEMIKDRNCQVQNRR